jgi:hypothetical protein
MVGAIVIIGLPAFGQPLVGLSAKIGILVSDTFQTVPFHFLATIREGNSATRRYAVGAGVLLRLPRFLGTGGDFLYKRVGYDLTTSTPSIPVVNERTWTTANSWEFPSLGVYLFSADLEARIGPIRLTSEIRYTRWRPDAGVQGSLIDLRSNCNQIDLLLGTSFLTRSAHAGSLPKCGASGK